MQQDTALWIQTKRLQHCYLLGGKGRRVLFLGGTGWDIRTDTAPFATPLADHFEILHVDQRGMGRSEKPPGPYTMSDYADDAAALLDSFDWDMCYVIGFSFGGMVAQELAIRHPNRVSGMALISTTAGGAGGSSAPIHTFADWAPYERAKKALEVSDLRFSETFQSQYPEQAIEMIKARLPQNPEFLEEPGAREGRDAQLMARAAHDCFDRLHNIKCKTLVVGGESDGQAPVAAVKNLSQGIEHSQLVILPGAHGLIFESNETYSQIVSFFNGLD